METLQEFSPVRKGIIELGTGFTGPTFSSPYIIHENPPFERVRLPDKQLKKLAYDRMFDDRSTDFEIELMFIHRYERVSHHRVSELSLSQETIDYERQQLKLHYRGAVAIVSPRMARGWNRWSEQILDLFLSPTLHHVLWGSGGCSKSSVLGLLLYIKWRVNPANRMVILATRVMAESKARVFSYLCEAHAAAPPSTQHRIVTKTGKDNRGIYVQLRDAQGKWFDHERGCILVVPIKVDAGSMTIGDNLIGNHPDDELILAFDEGQEIPGKIIDEKIFLNWLSNPRVYSHCWGNPNPVAFHATMDYDLLFRLGVGIDKDNDIGNALTEKQLKDLETRLEKDDTWTVGKSTAVRLSTMNSPKDDPEEANNWHNTHGVMKHRLEFLAGKNSVDQLDAGTPKHCAAYYSQVYGFPFVDYVGEGTKGVLTPRIVQVAQDYPVQWRTEPGAFEYFMGVDSAPTGMGDDCAIAVGRRGLMMDGRAGIDVMDGKYCVDLRKDEGETRDFTDVVIDKMISLSSLLRIPMCNIGVETHSAGEVLKYALEKSINEGKWGTAWKTTGKFFIVSPVMEKTDRHLFKELGKFQPACDIVSDINTEYYLAVRCAIMTRQMFNLPKKALGQFYNRQLKMDTSNTKYRVETKTEMKKRGVKSPNSADAVANMLEVMRRQGKFGYSFKVTGAYETFFTAERDQMMEDFELGKRLGRVSQLMGLGADLSQYAGEGRKPLPGRAQARNRPSGSFNWHSV